MIQTLRRNPGAGKRQVGILSCAAVDSIVTGAAVQEILALLSEQGVVPFAAVQFIVSVFQREFFDHVAADQQVVAQTTNEQIWAITAEETIIVGAAKKHIVAATADQRCHTGEFRRVNHVVAVTASQMGPFNFQQSILRFAEKQYAIPQCEVDVCLFDHRIGAHRSVQDIRAWTTAKKIVAGTGFDSIEACFSKQHVVSAKVWKQACEHYVGGRVAWVVIKIGQVAENHIVAVAAEHYVVTRTACYIVVALTSDEAVVSAQGPLLVGQEV